MSRFLLTVIIFVAIDGVATAQSQQWIQYYLEIPLNESYAILPEGGYRMESGTISQYLVRLAIGRDITPDLNTAIGFTHLGFFSKGNRITNEYRPHQQASFSHSLTEKMGIDHRFRIEERFRDKINDNSIIYNRFNMRFRYRLMLSYLLFDWSVNRPGKALVLSFGSEVFLSAFKNQHNPYDQNRFLISPTFSFNEKFSLALTYNGQLTQIENEMHLTSIIWLQAIHTLN